MVDQTTQDAQDVAGFLQSFTSKGGFRLRFRVKAIDLAEPSGGSNGSESKSEPYRPKLFVEFSGPDTPILTARNGELLNALEHIATQILRLEPEHHDRVFFDAERFKANRDLQMREMAAEAVKRVKATHRPYTFPAMSSRERRMLHLFLSDSGLRTASSGEGPGRFVVLYPPDFALPAGDLIHQPVLLGTSAVRKAFRPR